MAIDQQRLQYLLERNKTQTSTAAERAELEHWYQEFENRSNFTEGLSNTAQKFLEDRLLSGIESRISQQTEDRPLRSLPQPAVFGRFRGSGLYRIAAVFIGLLLVTTLIYQYSRPSSQSGSATELITLATAYGKTREINLPDGSKVVLNGNSEISYPKAWADGQIREVSLRGEAYFQVIHTHDHRRFKVRTADDFSVEVLGTQFTVSKRNRGTRVVLNQGRVQCNLESKKGADTLLLKPGDLVEFAKKPSQYTRRQVDPTLYSVWTEHKLVFKNTSLREITAMLNETYGFMVNVENPDLLNRRISGSIPTDHVDLVLEGIAETCRLTVRKKDNHIYLTDNTP
jgi:transmembrane sensor